MADWLPFTFLMVANVGFLVFMVATIYRLKLHSQRIWLLHAALTQLTEKKNKET